mmetsp:Transcript_120613/g.209991  ORF Transcript_120613/g.209991 Transcript_120613/m.209991 type:complete len:191 (-) Transcript_120613:742-1314(-)
MKRTLFIGQLPSSARCNSLVPAMHRAKYTSVHPGLQGVAKDLMVIHPVNKCIQKVTGPSAANIGIPLHKNHSSAHCHQGPSWVLHKWSPIYLAFFSFHPEKVMHVDHSIRLWQITITTEFCSSREHVSHAYSGPRKSGCLGVAHSNKSAKNILPRNALHCLMYRLWPLFPRHLALSCAVISMHHMSSVHL